MIRVTRDAKRLCRLEILFFAALALAAYFGKQIPWGSL